MLGGFWLGAVGEDVRIVLRGRDQPSDAANALDATAAAWRVDEWFSGGSNGSALEEICLALDAHRSGPDRAAKRELIRRALLDGRLLALRVKVALVSTRAPERAEAPPPKETRTEPTLVDLWVRLDIHPETADKYDDKFVVTSTDGAYKQTKTVKDDQVPGDQSIDLEFNDLYPDKKYNLQIVPARGAPHYVFRDVPYAALGGIAAAAATAAPPPPAEEEREVLDA